MDQIEARNFDNESLKTKPARNSEPGRTAEAQRPNIASEYDRDIDQLRIEKRELENLLNNSSPARLRFLKLTRQISEDPHLDLHIVASTLEMKEQYRELDLREARSEAERDGEELNVDPEPARRVAMTREEARTFAEIMDDNGAKPNVVLQAFADGLTDSYEFSEEPDTSADLDEDVDIPY